MFVSFNKNREILVNELSKAIYDTNNSTAMLIGNNFQDLDAIFTEILTDTEFEKNIKILNDDHMNTQAHNWVMERMRSFRAKAISSNFDAVIVSTLDGGKHYGELVKSPFYDTDFEGSEIQKYLDASPTKKVIFPYEFNNEKYLVFGIKSTNLYIHLYKKLNEIENLYSDIDFKNGETAIFSTQRQFIIPPPTIAQELLLTVIPPNENGYMIHKLENTDYVISYEQIPESSFYFTSIVPLNHVYQRTDEVMNTLLLVCVISILISLLLGFLISRSIANPISHLQQLMKVAEKGDLRVKVDFKGKSELAALSQSFNKMVNEFITLIKEITKDTHILNKHSSVMTDISKKAQLISENNSAAFQEIAASTQNQADSALKCFAISEDLDEKIKNVIDFTTTIKDDIYQMVDMIDHGFKNMKLIVESSDNALSSSNQVMDSISMLQNDTTQINDITGIIKKNAEQANLLSLNASIEAARAGEHGRGFVVVADEMNKLSKNIQNSAKDIEMILKHVVDDIKQVYSCSKDSNNIVEEQIELVNTSNDLFKEINELSDTTLKHIGGIDQVMHEMNSSNVGTQNSIKSISSTAEENAATTQQLSASTTDFKDFIDTLHTHVRQLEELSNTLVSSVTKFKVDDGE